MTTPAAELTTLANDFGWALGVVVRRYRKASGAVLADVPGGGRGYHVLAAIATGEPRRQLELAHHLGIDRTVMTYLLDDLEKAGLVARNPDPADRRARLVSLTEAGATLAKRTDERLGEVESAVLSDLAEDERIALRALMRRVADSAAGTAGRQDVCAELENDAC